MSINPTPATPDRHYRRWIEGAGLSLEANTPNTPTEGVYYVIQEGVVFFSSDDLVEAGEVFDRLRVNHWEGLLASDDPKQRLDGARGLARHDHTHVRALAVLAADGTAGDLKRVAQARNRARFAARPGAPRRGVTGGAADRAASKTAPLSPAADRDPAPAP